MTRKSIPRVVAVLCILSVTSMFTGAGAAVALDDASSIPVSSATTTTDGICTVNALAMGSTDTSLVSQCWRILLGMSIVCAGCVVLVLDPVPGTEIVACQACVVAIARAAAAGCLE